MKKAYFFQCFKTFKKKFAKYPFFNQGIANKLLSSKDMATEKLTCYA